MMAECYNPLTLSNLYYLLGPSIVTYKLQYLNSSEQVKLASSMISFVLLTWDKVIIFVVTGQFPARGFYSSLMKNVSRISTRDGCMEFS